MYIYLDKTGVVKEIINDEALRQSSSNANTIYVYFDGYQEDDVSSVLATYELPDGTLLPEAEVATETATSEIPYNAERDLKFFNYYTEYPFYVFKVTDLALSQSGVVRLTLRMVCQSNTTIKTQGLICFSVEAEAVQADYNMALSQYNYLVKLWTEIDLAEYVKKSDNNVFTGENEFRKSVYIGGSDNKNGMNVDYDGAFRIWDEKGDSLGFSYLPTSVDGTIFYLAHSATPEDADLAKYALRSELPNMADYVTKSSLSATLTNYVTNTKLSTELSSYLTKESAKGTYATTNDLINFVDKTKNATFYKDVSVLGSMTVSGNVTVNGTFTKVNSETISTKNHTIGLALGNTAKITDYLGLYATKYDGTNDGGLMFGNTGTAYVGDVVVDANGKVTDASNMQPLLTRSEADELTDGAILFWDADSFKAVQKSNGTSAWSSGDLANIVSRFDDFALLETNTQTFKTANGTYFKPYEGSDKTHPKDYSFINHRGFTSHLEGVPIDVTYSSTGLTSSNGVLSLGLPLKTGILAYTPNLSASDANLDNYAKKTDIPSLNGYPTLAGENTFTGAINRFENVVVNSLRSNYSYLSLYTVAGTTDSPININFGIKGASGTIYDLQDLHLGTLTATGELKANYIRTTGNNDYIDFLTNNNAAFGLKATGGGVYDLKNFLTSVPTTDYNKAGGTKSKFVSDVDSDNVWESGFNIAIGNDHIIFIRFGRFKQESGSSTESTAFSFKTAMFGAQANSSINTHYAIHVSVILGDSIGQSTTGGYMGSLAVDSATYSGFNYRASNGEKGYVYYMAFGYY